MTDFEKDEITGLWRVPCSPKTPVILTSMHERALGKLIRATTVSKPESDAMIDLVGDAFFSLYRHTVETAETVSPDRQVNKTLIDWTMSLPDFQQSKTETVGNMPAALAAAGVLWETLSTEDALQDALKKQDEADDLEKQAVEHYKNAAEAAEQGDDEAADEEFEKAEQARQQAQQAAQQAVEQLEKMQKNPLAQGMVKAAARKAGEKGEEVAAVMKGWGIEPGEISFEESDEVLKLVDMAGGRMKDIAEYIGRMKGVAARSIESIRASYTGAVSEPMLTKDIHRLFPLSRAYITSGAPPYLRAKSIASLMSGGLLGWKPKFEGKKSGSFACMVDRSGSMSDGDLTIAKAVAVGIAKALLDDDQVIDRKYRLTFFQSEVDKELTVSSENDWREHVKWAGVASAGGTNFDDALEYACQQINEFREAGIQGADILFITDDECRVSDDTLELVRNTKEATGARLMVVKIKGGYYGSGWGGSLDDDADMIIEVDRNSFTEDAAADIVEQLVTNIIKAEYD